MSRRIKDILRNDADFNTDHADPRRRAPVSCKIAGCASTCPPFDSNGHTPLRNAAVCGYCLR